MKKKTTKKDNLIDENIEEKIINVEYSEIMQKSYIDYAMSVIIARALPDIRDGLKPVQRRIAYDMGELGAASDKPYRKSARIVGDTMGKYHPHGDSSIYEALVVMSQDFKKGKTLIDGHGNFGSIEGDPSAASRYTEARLEPFTEKVLLADLKSNTVSFQPNYDENEKEPTILPAKLPLFLINGSEGIAVGMTTSTPTHNIDEVIDTAIHYFDNPKSTNEELLSILKGPDFPTGGIVSNKSDLQSIYETGSGKIKIRGTVVFEAGKGNEKDKLVITEIPYTMIGEGISKFLQSIADLVENKTLPEIIDITNQTSNEGIRIVLELKKGSDHKYVENILYKKTKLEDTFGVNMLAVSNNKPEIMSLVDIMKAYSDFQYEIYTNKFKSLLSIAEEKKEIYEGLIKATDVIDTIIDILRGSKSQKQAKECLMTGKTTDIKFKTKASEKKAMALCFTEKQTIAILDMRLAKLIGLEIEALQKDLNIQNRLIVKYNKLLNSKTELKKEIKTQLLELKKEFHQERRTKIIDAKPIEIKEKEEEECPMVILVDKFFYTHSIDMSVYEKNKETIENDYKYAIKTTNKSKLVVFCDVGKAHVIKVSEIPYGRLRDKGQPLDNICNFDSYAENVVYIESLNTENPYLIFISTNGFVKKVNIQEFDVTRKTVDATKLKDNSKIASINAFDNKGYLILGTKDGMFIRFKQEEIVEQKKNTVGTIGIKLADNDEVIFAQSVINAKNEIIINETVYTADKIKLIKRGGKGTKTKFN